MVTSDYGIIQIVAALQELSDDSSVPKNVKIRINGIISLLGTQQEFSIKINRALDQFEDLTNDTNLMPHTRTQIWNVVSLLETCSCNNGVHE